MGVGQFLIISTLTFLSTPFALAEDIYDRQIAELSAQLAEIDCTGKTGMDMLKCSSKEGELEALIDLAKSRQEGQRLNEENKQWQAIVDALSERTSKSP